MSITNAEVAAGALVDDLAVAVVDNPEVLWFSEWYQNIVDFREVSSVGKSYVQAHFDGNSDGDLFSQIYCQQFFLFKGEEYKRWCSTRKMLY